MSLSSQVSSIFNLSAQMRGADYFRMGVVTIVSGSDESVQARVRGSRTYKPSLEWTGRDLAVYCDCPYFDDVGPCKHLWATVLAAEAAGHLTRLDLPSKPERAPAAPAIVNPPRPPKMPRWREHLNEIDRRRTLHGASSGAWSERRELLYTIDLQDSRARSCVVLALYSRERRKSGEGWNRTQQFRLPRRDIACLPNAVDREVLGIACGAQPFSSYYSYYDSESVPSRIAIDHILAARLMPLMCATGRCMVLRSTPEDLVLLEWDDGDPWRFTLELTAAQGNRKFLGALRRGDRLMDVREPQLLTPGGLVFTGGRVALLDENTPFEWVPYLRECGSIDAAENDIQELLAALLEHPSAPALNLPDELRYEEAEIAPRPCFRIRSTRPYSSTGLRGELSFDYAGRRVAESAKSRGFYDAPARRFVPRDPEAERAAVARLHDIGLRQAAQSFYEPEPAWLVTPKKLPAIVRALAGVGWHVEAEGKAFRSAGASRVQVTSGIDWFELRGEVQYGEVTAKLPDLLAALRRGENMVRLDDGAYGLLPEEWLAKFGALADMGAAENDHLRFRRNQAGLLDALLSAQPEARFDEDFARVREELRQFDGIRVAQQPAGFTGTLRDYQREGLGWMEFLRRFGFGGCLADDMGVGKTAQVLALLEQRREAQDGAPPSLIVVPKSLIFNWKQEAARFTPRLRVLDYTGLGRSVGESGGCEVILTTYGTLRRDILRLKDMEFDYIVLDEAQAIKNSQSESAKAARLLRGRHRLALSGTPVENHLGELWSLFDFLNPGMLGSSRVLKGATGLERNPDEGMRKLLSQCLRPFILRRTKNQVARELPEKTEQTVYCVMDPPQRKLYEELREHYRNTLLGRIEKEGLAKSKIQVLEALLRLRQAACHPGLLDPARSPEPSAKLEVLIEHVSEVIEEGHKALVFSQFTSLLRIVRDRLDEKGAVYEYLDGATHDRQARVERFQNDPDCRLFLISLKAGGLGLNLTAAEYVFLLDPWWNPAVEAQAIDRTHRIGQTRQVFAYRLIARDTVEEKVIELQETKRELAAAIFTADNALMRNLQREDLELLLS